MLACVDVGYRVDRVIAGCVCLRDWTDEVALCEQKLAWTERAQPYVPGQFFKRELPYLLGILRQLRQAPAIVVVDGYVRLEGGRAGLGQHLYEALAGSAAVVGVAKHAYRAATEAVAVLRGGSRIPLYISAVGIAVDDAVLGVRSMAGAHRIPAMLKRADRLTRL